MYNPITPGICGICEKTVIFKRDERGRLRETEDYIEFSFMMSDEAVATHGICKGCHATLTEEKVKAVFGRIQASWFGEMVGWGTEKQFERLKALKVVAFDRDKNSIKKHSKELKKELHLDRLKKAKEEKEKKK